MKILLLKDVPKVGKKYDIKDVADGFARNSLFPKKLAEPATGDTVKRILRMKQEAARAGEVATDLLTQNLAILNSKIITIKAKTNEKGHLFSAIHKKEILEAIHRDLGISISEDALVLDKPIKETGEHVLEAQVGGVKSRCVLDIKSVM